METVTIRTNIENAELGNTALCTTIDYRLVNDTIIFTSRTEIALCVEGYEDDLDVTGTIAFVGQVVPNSGLNDGYIISHWFMVNKQNVTLNNASAFNQSVPAFDEWAAAIHEQAVKIFEIRRNDLL